MSTNKRIVMVGVFLTFLVLFSRDYFAMRSGSIGPYEALVRLAVIVAALMAILGYWLGHHDGRLAERCDVRDHEGILRQRLHIAIATMDQQLRDLHEQSPVPLDGQDHGEGDPDVEMARQMAAISLQVLSQVLHGQTLENSTLPAAYFGVSSVEAAEEATRRMGSAMLWDETRERYEAGECD